MVSCVDTVLLPDDKTVEEDFWQTKSDVSLMVNGAYWSMAGKDIQERMIVWTSRSDELNANSTLNNSALNQIHSANIQTTNGYNSWGAFYAVINQCNLVISQSADVMDIDPNYLEGDHRNNIGQMKALRALCYFYLVRAFRDVPLILEPYKLSSQEMNVPQVAPSVVIDQIIADLEEVKNYTLSSQTVTGWERCGYFTRDGVYALLADVYLWKASIYGDESCYDKCIACCNAIREKRKGASLPNQGGYNGGLQQLDDDGYGLNPYYNYYNIFADTGNDSESLLELQFTNNEGLCIAYNRSKNNNTLPNFYTNTVYAQISPDDNHVFNHANYKYDVRGFASIHDFNSGSEEALTIRKFVAKDNLPMVAASAEWKAESKMEREYGNYDQNWIFYRVTDVMLMKAEALVQKAALKAQAHAGLLDQIAAAATSEDSLELAQELRLVNRTISACNVEAVRQVQIVSTRARTDGKSEADSTKYDVAKTEYDGGDIATFVRSQVNAFSGFAGSAEELEILVMNERARELCFEGKRWFDMLRYNYRHTTGVNYDLIFAQQGGNFAPNYDEMLKLIARKYTSGGGSGVTSKMPTEPYLYMPVAYSEVAVNPMLCQNPVYTDGSTTEKNY